MKNNRVTRQAEKIKNDYFTEHYLIENVTVKFKGHCFPLIL